MSALATVAMTEQDAQRLTERIRLTAHNYAEARRKLQELVAEAKEGNAHLALGYPSWTAYLAEVLGEEPMRLARGERQEMVQMLSAEGMSTRAIAPIVGVSQSSIRDDLREVSGSYSPESTAPVQGMDGKTYTRPEAQQAVQAERNASEDVDIINDVRLYLRHLARSPKIARLTPAGKQHIIDALTNTISELKKD